MQKNPVKSSNIKAAGYDINENVLEVEFRGGKVYQYLGVPEQEYNDFMGAESKGRHLHEKIKGKYAHRKMQ